ncbi:MAG TPA: terminase family protein [Stenomitos sp.]
MIVTQSRKHLVDFEIATNTKYKPNWHHEIIGRELEKIEQFGDRDYKILIVTVPPRHGKSQQCSIDFPAWFLGRNPSKEIITASYSADLAQDFGGKTREKVDSPQFQAIFPEIKLKEDEKARGRWRTKDGGAYTAVGVGGPITGRGANVLLVDDPIKNREEAESEVIRAKVWDWFTSTAFTRLEPNGVVIIIMTRWHMDDLAGKILAHPTLSKRTRLIRFPAIAEKDNPPFRKLGEPLWKDKYPVDSLLEIKNTIGPYDWAALYQGNPVLTENQEFKPQWIRKITEHEVSMMQCRRYLTIDTAMSKTAQADFTGFCDNSVNRENFWHLRAWQSKIGPEELVNALFALHESNNYDRIGIERTAYLDGLKPYLDSEQRRRNVFLPIVELTHRQTAKEIRVRGLIPVYASKSVFHIEGKCTALEEQMINFPVGMHDDVLDATAYQLQIMEQDNNSQISVGFQDYSL